MNCKAARRATEGDAFECSPDVAQWLHDEVVQRLASVAAALGAEGRLGDADRVRCRAELQRALRALGELLDDGLEPPPPRRFRTVAEAVRAAATLAGGELDLRIYGDTEIPAPTGELVADFVAEAMRNVVKHAQPRVTVLTVTVTLYAIRVDAFNDGVEPAQPSERSTGLGLRLLAARARDHEACVSARPVGAAGWSTTLLLMRRSTEGGRRARAAKGAGR